MLPFLHFEGLGYAVQSNGPLAQVRDIGDVLHLFHGHSFSPPFSCLHRIATPLFSSPFQPFLVVYHRPKQSCPKVDYTHMYYKNGPRRPYKKKEIPLVPVSYSQNHLLITSNACPHTPLDLRSCPH
jgi:hypothetical protein